MNGAAAMLIVEDNPDDVNLIRRALRKAKVDVPHHVATDGDQALEFLGAITTGCDALRVVLLDLKLPRRSGFDVLAWMRAHPKLRRVPVVVLTSSAINTDLQRAYDLGANSYLVKPQEQSALVEMMENIDAYWLRTNRLPAQLHSDPLWATARLESFGHQICGSFTDPRPSGER